MFDGMFLGKKLIGNLTAKTAEKRKMKLDTYLKVTLVVVLRDLKAVFTLAE